MELKVFEFQALFDWYTIHGRKHLPWREYCLDAPKENLPRTPKERGYRVWLSEILLQQTQADRVVDFYKRILTQFPTIEDLAKTDYETFFPYYQWLGYYSRARNILACSRTICEKYDGVFPTESSLLKELPGIWPYTAEAIRSFAYKIPTLSFDTNLKKVFARYYFGSRFHSISLEMEEILLRDFQNFSGTTGICSSDINAAFMDLWGLWSKNSKDAVDFSESPFKNCLFTNTWGILEKQIIREKKYFPTPDAKIVSILHENHKTYYSENPTCYVPFVLEPLAISDTTMKKYSVRDRVKEYFKAMYSLEVSVRPEHKKIYIAGVPYVFVRTQIQSWKHRFKKFWKEVFEEGIRQFEEGN